MLSPTRFSAAAITALTLLTAIACDAEQPAPDTARAAQQLDLSRFGVERVVADDGGFTLLAADDAPLGRVDVHVDDGVTELDVELGDRAAEVTWSDAGSALRCDGGALLEQSAGDESWAPRRTAAHDGACDDALALGFEIAVATDNAPPWAAQFESNDDEFRWLEGNFEPEAGVCSTVDTWVGGSSCWSCTQAASTAFGRGPGWTESSSTCSSGTLWTSCSVTFCL